MYAYTSYVYAKKKIASDKDKKKNEEKKCTFLFVRTACIEQMCFILLEKYSFYGITIHWSFYIICPLYQTLNILYVNFYR